MIRSRKTWFSKHPGEIKCNGKLHLEQFELFSSGRLQFVWLSDWVVQTDSYSLRSGSLNLTLVKKYILINQLCLFARAAETNLHNRSGLEQQKYIVFGLWRLEVWNQGLQDYGPFETCRPCFFLVSGSLQTIFWLLWLRDSSFQSSAFPPGVYLSKFSLFIRTAVHWIRAHSVNLSLN